ncbi:uncharacterized protein LOC122404276 [Colletes gigas]|uniref:uncharacterized protein LOC122404276 n=1 Tax=Colletes gigas TaxID=935657 RepID=UPI001C9B066F|nr:uncharacterized protein LOC122404276 [Colletes gigas]
MARYPAHTGTIANTLLFPTQHSHILRTFLRHNRVVTHHTPNLTITAHHILLTITPQMPSLTTPLAQSLTHTTLTHHMPKCITLMAPQHIQILPHLKRIPIHIHTHNRVVTHHTPNLTITAYHILLTITSQMASLTTPLAQSLTHTTLTHHMPKCITLMAPQHIQILPHLKPPDSPSHSAHRTQLPWDQSS